MNYIEYGLSRIFASAKGRDARPPAFALHPTSTISISCPEVGPTGSHLHVELSAEGAGRFPTLHWPEASPETKEYLLISEDPDAPLPNPIIYGIYYGIPSTATGVRNIDFEKAAEPWTLKGGFKHGKNRRGNIYVPPRPLLGHGPHHYFFTLIALNERIDSSKLSALPTAEEMAGAIEGKVVGWGEWIGVYERKWE